jgi:hypothetical protein
VAAYLVLILLLAIPAVPIYSFVEPTYKLLVIRVCTGIVLLFTLHRLVRVAREPFEQQPASALDAAALRQGGAIEFAPAFEKLRDEVTNSMRDRSYFGHVLRPRLLALLDRRLRARRGIGVAVLMQQSGNGLDPALLALLTHAPGRRRLSWRGIPLRELQALVQMLEELS